jgi:hypothetical protein
MPSRKRNWDKLHKETTTMRNWDSERKQREAEFSPPEKTSFLFGLWKPREQKPKPTTSPHLADSLAEADAWSKGKKKMK